MPIPTRFDHQLADVENAASAVLLTLRTMQHADPRSLPAMRTTLRERLQAFVDLAMATARREV